MRKPLPTKKKGKLTGPRRIAGELLDVATQAQQLGVSEKTLRNQIARKLIPHRRLGGRIVLVAAEVRDFLSRLPGVTVEQALANLAARSGGEGAR